MPKRRVFAVDAPSGTFSVRRRRVDGSFAVYWYFQKRRGQPDQGPLIPIPGNPTRREFWEKIASITGEPAVEPRTVNSLIAEYKAGASYKALGEASVRAYDIYIREIEARWNGLRVDGLTPEAIRRFIDTFNERPVAGNLCLSILTTILAWGSERGYCRTNPAREITKFKTDDDGARAWPEDAWQRVATLAPEVWRRVAILGRATGQRASDLVKMRPADWDSDGINHTIKKLKDRPHWAPVNPQYAAIIRGWDCPPMVPYLMRHTGGRHSARSLGSAWDSWRESAAGKRLGAGELNLHGLRALAVCDDRIRGYPHQKIAARRGMSTQMVMRYSRFIDQRLIAEDGPADVVQLQTFANE